ncbi:hypothetical protein [Rhizobium leguminosarum]|uniref:hypothetical protein n=1 Tax=Rhizobium leguminosarum TaxID=384 RepID=UPI0021B13E02|nr:hypothetical protein [Rhizobium leguminosarum]
MHWISRLFATGAAFTLASIPFDGFAQSVDANLAINRPDEASWRFLAYVAAPVAATPGKVLFETWASNEDTFTPHPVFPGAKGDPSCGQSGAAAEIPTPVASPKILSLPALQQLAPMGLVPHGSPDGSEEVRRNHPTFDYIVCNQLFTKAGLRSFYKAGRPISAPVGAMEVKADWVPADEVDSADYYVSEAPDGKKYALIAMHIISKVLPNWTWATFEHQNNPGRCDYTGCHDAYGAVVADVEANEVLDRRYSDCAKNDALKATLSSAGLSPVWEHYCLKGSQTDFVSATGLPTLLGNSVTEAGFADTSSCITCHARAAVNAKGIMTTRGGFVDPPIPALCPNPSGSCSPNGAPDPNWFWTNPGKLDQAAVAMQTDFIWSIARFAIGH